MNQRYLSRKNVNRYFDQIMWYYPKIKHKTYKARDKLKTKVVEQLQGICNVSLEKCDELITKLNTQTYQNNPIKGLYEQVPEAEELDEKEQQLVHQILIQTEAISISQQKQQQYELDLTGTVERERTTVTRTTNTATNFEIVPTTYEVANNNTFAENVDETSKQSAKVLVMRWPRAFASLAFNKTVVLNVNTPEYMVELITPQVRALLNSNDSIQDDETLQATQILQQLHGGDDMFGQQVPQTPQTSKSAVKRGRKRKNTNQIDEQPVKKPRGRKPFATQKQQANRTGLLEFYENAQYEFGESNANAENTNINVTQNERQMLVSGK